MNRRGFLAGASATALAGCLGSLTGNDGSGNGGSDNDGYAPELEETPEERSIDVDAYETVDRDGVAVPLAPIEDAYYWYARRAARFVDARGETSYRRAHVTGAVLSPAPDGRANDPVAEWSTSDRIVCYCGCPHHLSSMRAASLLSNGYENVYVIDEGFGEWHERGYPMAGRDVEDRPSLRVIEGATAPEFAGETAWVRHAASGQREATPIADDGSYELHLRFSSVDDDSVVSVQTPEYEIEGALGELTAGVVTGESG